MFEKLLREAHREMAKAHFEMSRCNDMYRLNQILTDLNYEIGKLADESYDCVEELENEPV